MRTEYGRFYQINARTDLPMWWMYGSLIRVTSNQLGAKVYEYVGNPGFVDWSLLFGGMRVGTRTEKFLPMQPEEVQREFGDSNGGDA